jgi:transketolase
MSEQTIEKNSLVGLSSRDAYGKVIVELADQHEEIVGLSADLSGSVKLSDFREKCPERFIDFGIAEQNMMGAAAGLTLAGIVPFVSTYAVFSSMRACEQVRTDVAYNELPVKIVSTHSGISLGVAGATHHALEDIGIFRGMPGMTVLSPADAVETASMLNKVMEIEGPVYVRLSRAKEKTVYQEIFDYKVGKPDHLVRGQDILLIATGPEVGESLEAITLLEECGIHAGLLNVSSLKPININEVVAAIEQYPVVLTVEQGFITNGLGSAIAEIIAEQNINVKIFRHGILDQFTTSGPYRELLNYYKLDTGGIKDTVLKVLDR